MFSRVVVLLASSVVVSCSGTSPPAQQTQGGSVQQTMCNDAASCGGSVAATGGSVLSTGGTASTSNGGIVAKPDSGTMGGNVAKPDSGTMAQCIALDKTCDLVDDDCCDGTFCQFITYATNKCVKKFAIGEECYDDSVCESNSCINSVCTTATCVTQDSTCDVIHPCCAGLICFIEPLTYGPQKCQPPLPDGSPCMADSDCAFNQCTNYVCGAPDAGTMSSCSDTWSSFGQQFFANNCNSCHAANQKPIFNSRTVVAGASAMIQAQISSGNMPKNGTLSAQNVTRILNYLSCGVP